VGDGVTVGNSSEVKNSLMFDNSQIPHFAYVGDSIMGWRAHLGAGVKLSNVKLIREPIVVVVEGKSYNTGLIKFGAIIGDEVDIGCNSVLNPGSIIGRRTVMYTNVAWRGYCPANSVVKLRQNVEVASRR
jgi:NDP-sugar pyrophosphorylase family protein